MIVDSSAVVAVLHGEPDSKRYTDAIEKAPVRRMSAANLFEAAIVVDKQRDPVLSRRLDQFVQEAGITVENVTLDQVRLARAAYRDFGKGSGHPAQLNFGDCYAYALAKAMNEPLLYKGANFSQTDVASAV